MSLRVTISSDFKGLEATRQAVRRAVQASVVETALLVDADAKRNAPVDTGRLRSSIHAEGAGLPAPGQDALVGVTTDELNAVVGTNVEYAAAQEYGAVVEIPVTAKSRRFFWAKFRETGEAKWKGMALSKKPLFIVRFDGKLYLTRAYHQHRDALRARIAQRLGAL